MIAENGREGLKCDLAIFYAEREVRIITKLNDGNTEILLNFDSIKTASTMQSEPDEKHSLWFDTVKISIEHESLPWDQLYIATFEHATARPLFDAFISVVGGGNAIEFGVPGATPHHDYAAS